MNCLKTSAWPLRPSVLLFMAILSISLLIQSIQADYTQMGWDLPYHDAQHTSLAPTKGPNSGASVRWSVDVEGRLYPSGFTVAGHVGHVFITDGAAKLMAFDTLGQGAKLWEHRILPHALTVNGSQDTVPVIVESDEVERRIVVSACQIQIPRVCQIDMVDEDGKLIWSVGGPTTTFPISTPTSAPNIPAIKELGPTAPSTTPSGTQPSSPPTSNPSAPASGSPSPHSPSAAPTTIPFPPPATDWTGRIYQIVTAQDGDILIVPKCPQITTKFYNDCVLIGMNSADGNVMWSRQLPGLLRGDLLRSRGGIVLVPMCEAETLRQRLGCLNIFSAYRTTDGELLWQITWTANSSAAFSSHTRPHLSHNTLLSSSGEDFAENDDWMLDWTNKDELDDIFDSRKIAKRDTPPYEMTMITHFTGLVADDVFVTLAEDVDGNVFVVGTDMNNGARRFKNAILDASNSRFVAAAASPVHGSARQLFFMTGDDLFSIDTTGTTIWSNRNFSNTVRSMAIDPAGAIYVATSRANSAGSFTGGLDVYDARGGSLSYSLKIDSCTADYAAAFPIIPAFAITAERWVTVLCKGRLAGMYSPAVPLWVWITITAAFAALLCVVFVIGFIYHRRHKNQFEVIG